MPVRYEYNWNPLVGCLQGLLRAAGLPHDAARVSAVSGEAFRLPSLAAEPQQPAFAAGADQPRDLSALAGDLALLGLRARVDVWDLRSGRRPLLGRRLGRRLRRALADGRAAAVSGVAGGDFGLLVGYDGDAPGLSGGRSAERGDRRLAAGGPRPGPGRGLAGGRDPRGGDARGPGGRGGARATRSRASARRRPRAALARLGGGPALGGRDRRAGARPRRAGAGRGVGRGGALLPAGGGGGGRRGRPAGRAGGRSGAGPVALRDAVPVPGGGDVVAGGREAGARSLLSAMRAEAALAAGAPPPDGPPDAGENPG